MTTHTHQPENARLVECFTAVFPDASKEEIVSATQATMTEWDSLATVNLITLIEEQFKVSIPVEQIEDLVSFDAFARFLAQSEVDAEF
jgi:acyl carrier protein